MMRLDEMKLSKKIYSVSTKGSKNYQSVTLTEGFEVSVDEDFDEFEYETQKAALKDRLITETKQYLNTFVEEREMDDSIEL